MDSAEGPVDIAEMWRNKFEMVLNATNDQNDKQKLRDRVSNPRDANLSMVSLEETFIILLGLKEKKGAGMIISLPLFIKMQTFA